MRTTSFFRNCLFIAALSLCAVRMHAQPHPDTSVSKTDSLKEVSITSKKQLLQMSLGKITVNVDASPSNIGINVLELMRKLPGITVDKDGNISMQGKQGVLVLIDDKPTYLTGSQLADYLRSIPADDIGQVELASQPSARYDASGNAGVINLKWKRSRRPGLFATATLTAAESVYPYALGSMLVSYNKRKLSLSLSADEDKASGFANWTETQTLSDATSGNTTNITNISSHTKEQFSIANAHVAGSYQWSDKASFGAMLKGGYHTNQHTDNVYYKVLNTDSNKTSYSNIISPGNFIRKDASANLWYTYKTSEDQRLDINADYLNFVNSPYQQITTSALDANMQPLPNPSLLNSHQPSEIDIYSFKIDYIDTLQDGTRLEAGIKASYVITDNDAAFSTYQNSMWINDTARSNHFVYKENINAAYLSAHKKLGEKWDGRAGLRMENTNVNGVQQVHGQSFSKSYTSLFPTINIVFKPNSNHQWELDYGRRIDRPSYRDLNPFIFYSFSYTYNVGNPGLQPQFTNSVELKHSYKNMLITSVSFTNTTGVINDLLVANNATNVVYSTEANVGTNNAINASLTFNKDIWKWLTVNAYATFFYAHYTGMVNGYNINTSGPGFFSGCTTSFSFIKGWRAEAAAYYSGNYVSGIMSTVQPGIYTSCGASKKISDRSTLKLAVEDPFYAYRFREQYALPGLHTTSSQKYNTRSVAVSYTLSLGKSQSRKEASTLEESKRIKG